MTNTNRHLDELYKTGKTTFRDINAEYHDYVVSFNELVGKWALSEVDMLSEVIKDGLGIGGMCGHVYMYARDEIKQLCIDYYGDE